MRRSQEPRKAERKRATEGDAAITQECAASIKLFPKVRGSSCEREINKNQCLILIFNMLSGNAVAGAPQRLNQRNGIAPDSEGTGNDLWTIPIEAYSSLFLLSPSIQIEICLILSFILSSSPLSFPCTPFSISPRLSTSHTHADTNQKIYVCFANSRVYFQKIPSSRGTKGIFGQLFRVKMCSHDVQR